MRKVELEVLKALMDGNAGQDFQWPDKDPPVICCNCNRTMRFSTLRAGKQNDARGLRAAKRSHAEKCSEDKEQRRLIRETVTLDRHAINAM